MKEVPVFSAGGKRVGAIEFEDDVFGSTVRRRLLKSVVVASESARRRGTACTKERGQIKGSTRKPWRQKGTGYARAGSKKSPVWRGGGTVFGPRPRSFSKDIPRRQRRTALRSALALKLREGGIKIVKGLGSAGSKTADMRKLLNKIRAGSDAVVVAPAYNANLWLAARNLPKVDLVTAENLDARIVASRTNVVIAEEALDAVKGAGTAPGAKKRKAT